MTRRANASKRHKCVDLTRSGLCSRNLPCQEWKPSTYSCEIHPNDYNRHKVLQAMRPLNPAISMTKGLVPLFERLLRLTLKKSVPNQQVCSQ